MPPIASPSPDASRSARSSAANEPPVGAKELCAALVDSVDCIQLIDGDGRLLWSNGAGEHALGVNTTPGDRSWLEWWDAADRPAAIAALAETKAKRHSRFTGASGASTKCPKYWDVALSLLPDAPPPGTRILVIGRDVTPARHEEQRLRERAAQLSAIIEHEPECVKVVGRDGRLLEMNPAGLAMLEASSLAEAQQRPLLDYVSLPHRDAFKKLHREVLSGRIATLQFEVIGLRGGRRWLETRATPLRATSGQVHSLLGITRDITEKRQLEEHALHSQRLEGIGMLATGIAHDLNNVLSPILMAVPMLSREVTDPNSLKWLAMIKESVERGAGLVRQILSFGRRTSGEVQSLQPVRLIHELARVIEETFPKSIVFKKTVALDLWNVAGDPIQIQQVLLNLCVNARDALPRGGTLRIQAENCVLSADEAGRIPGGREGSFVRIEVRDSGTGIPPELLARIWEPFFTTKGPEKGTGLGLSTVRGIVERHGGMIAVESTVGHGSCFRVWLPAAEARPTADAESQPPSNSPGRGEVILVVDDEDSVRDVACAALTARGYRALAARDGQEAMAVLGSFPATIALAITDLNMPNCDGWTLIEHLRRFYPSIRILAISGSTDKTQPPAALPVDSVVFLPKPFSIETLWSHVDKLLSPASANAGVTPTAGDPTRSKP